MSCWCCAVGGSILHPVDLLPPLKSSYDAIPSVLSLCSVTSCLCIDKIPEAKTKVSKPTSRCGEICITPPKRILNERRRSYYSVCSVVAGDAVIRCERETTLFGLKREHN